VASKIYILPAWHSDIWAFMALPAFLNVMTHMVHIPCILFLVFARSGESSTYFFFCGTLCQQHYFCTIAQLGGLDGVLCEIPVNSTVHKSHPRTRRRGHTMHALCIFLIFFFCGMGLGWCFMRCCERIFECMAIFVPGQAGFGISCSLLPCTRIVCYLFQGP
jgi:hypothetical protein